MRLGRLRRLQRLREDGIARKAWEDREAKMARKAWETTIWNS